MAEFMKIPHTVVIILEAKPTKEAALKQALVKVCEPSRSEKTCIEYRLHQNQNNPAQFILYENWESKEAHQDQFNKPYVIDLIAEIHDLLARPYQAYFAHEFE